ncbi:O-antigen ligase family protein [Patescibacteria group bacterium]|nr:O-antigen ligase family protein [Patescibacteria group bacterium]
MVSAKERLYKRLIFVYLVLFPFGQILRTSISLYGRNIRLHPVDFVALIIFLLWIFEKSRRPKIYTWIKALVVTSVFSLLFSLSLFQLEEIYVGAMYLVRVFAYISVFLISWDVVREKAQLKSNLFMSLIAVSLATAIFGWIQYFLYPDLRSLAAYGWDDHYFRLIGTFLDPGFTSIILVFGLIATLAKYHRVKSKRLVFLSAFFLITIAFTYSRAGYLATLGGLLTLLYLKGKIRVFLVSVVVFILSILILPKPGGEGVNLGRTTSIFARVANYSETLQIFKKSPVFGVGFNNLCIYRERYLGYLSTDAHSCGGADSSLLFILAVTGILGLFVFAGLAIYLVKNVSSNTFGLTLLASMSAVFIHSFFHNSLFYPWVMGYFAILSAIGLKKSKGKS